MTGPDDRPAAGVGSGSRRAQMRRRRTQRKRRQVAVALVLAAALVLGVTAYLARREPPVPQAAQTTPRTQTTLLLQLQGPQGDGLASALLAHDPQGPAGAGLLVPSQVLAAPAGSRPLPYAQVLGSLGADASRKTLADLVGVAVDGAWVLDLPTAARLVDGVGGVDVGVDVPVLGGPGGATVLLQPGEQRVDGTRAVAFATFLAPDEPEQARLARLQELLDGLLAVLPPDEVQLTGLLDTLGPGSAVVGTDPPGVARVLRGLADDARADRLQYDVLPVVPVDTGAAQPSLRLDAPAAAAVVDRLLAPSVPEGRREGGNRVLVFNGVGTPLLGDRVRDALSTADLVYVAGGNASSFGVATTEVQVPDGSPPAVELGNRVARALGVPPSAVRLGEPTGVADVVVVVGADFVPPAG